jgi:hypothetical protein
MLLEKSPIYVRGLPTIFCSPRFFQFVDPIHRLIFCLEILFHDRHDINLLAISLVHIIQNHIYIHILSQKNYAHIPELNRSPLG